MFAKLRVINFFMHAINLVCSKCKIIQKIQAVNCFFTSMKAERPCFLTRIFLHFFNLIFFHFIRKASSLFTQMKLQDLQRNSYKMYYGI